MIRYKNLGSAISVDITSICTPEIKKDDSRKYIVECFYRYYKSDEASGYYQIDDVWLLRSDVELKIRIDMNPINGLEYEPLAKADKSNVKSVIRDLIVSIARANECFNGAIEQMDYIVDCFDVGDNVLWEEEQERIAKENDLS